MTIITRKYYRSGEDCNWQLDSEQGPKEVTEEWLEEFKEYGGFEYNARYNEFYSVAEGRLRMTKIIVRA